ncbi:MAG: DNA/RNA nuclease SfsA [Desulfotomaculales bacterium]
MEDAPQGLAGPSRAPLVPFPALQEAVFLARPNRFTARVRLAGREVAVFLPDSGRLPDLLVPGRRVFLRPATGPGRRTGHDLLLVDHDGILVSVDSRLPNRVFARALKAGLLPGLQVYTEVRREVGLPGSRLDFVLGGDGLSPCAVEVKSVTLVREGVALFPDAPTARGRRHVRELLRLRRAGWRAVVSFMIMRADALSFAPHAAEDRAFAGALREAAAGGVEVRAFTCRVSTAGVDLGDEVPVGLG